MKNRWEKIFLFYLVCYLKEVGYELKNKNNNFVFSSFYLFYHPTFILPAITKKYLAKVNVDFTESLVTSFNQMLEISGKPLFTFALDYTFWDEMVNFVQSQDKTWAEENIRQGAKSFGVDAVWVYNPDFSCIYDFCDFCNQGTSIFPLAKEELREIFSEDKRFAHFFVFDEKIGLLEVRGATIHPTNDPERKTLPKGYFLAAKLWNEDYLNQLARVTRCNIQIVRDKAIFKEKVGLGRVVFFRNLTSWDSRPVAFLRISRESPVILHLLSYNRNLQIIFILSLLVIFLITAVFFIYGVIMPVTKVTEELKKGGINNLVGLKEGKGELGELSRLIIRFLGEKDALHKEISLRKEAEAALQKSEQHYRLLAENVTDVIWTMDLALRFTYLSPSSYKLFGYTPDEIMKFGIRRLLPRSSVLKSLQILREELKLEFSGADHNRNRVIELEHICKDGKRIWCEVKVGFLRDEQGRAKGIIGVTRDITERKRIEDSLRQNENYLRSIFNSIQTGFIVIEAETKKIVDVNPLAAKLFGASPGDIIGKVCHQFICPAEVGKCPIDLGKTIEASECELIRSDGTRLPILKTVVSVKMYGRDLLLESFIDISERKKWEEQITSAHQQLKDMQEQLIQLAKLEAIGRLAAGVAHEVRNPLGIILQAADYLEGKVPKELEDSLGLIKDNVKRADAIIRSLVDFSKSKALILALEDINAVVESAIDLIYHRFNLENIELVKELSQDLPKVTIDKTRIEQVLVNLLINAMESMEKGGRILIRTQKRRLTKDELALDSLRENKGFFQPDKEVVVVEVEDTGKGISEENLKKVFEPFFTTKGPDRGTGLGLAVSKNIIDMHKGLLVITSKEKQGTKATVVLKIT